MMEEFKITDIYEVYQEKYLCNLPLEYVDEFMLVFDGKVHFLSHFRKINKENNSIYPRNSINTLKRKTWKIRRLRLKKNKSR